MSIPHIKRIVTFCSIGMCLLAIWLSKPTQTQSNTLPSASTQKRDMAVRASEQDTPISRQTYTSDQTSRFQDTEFYRTIIDNNIFRPIGWRPPRKKEPYRLIGTIFPTDGKTRPQAILQATAGNQTHTVFTGDKLGKDTIVIDIQSKQVTLENAGHQRILTLTHLAEIDRGFYMFDFDERQLIRRIQSGDHQASFTPLVLKYQHKIYQRILGRIKNTETAEDLVQETWLKAYLSINTFRGDAAFYSWLYRIAENVCMAISASKNTKKTSNPYTSLMNGASEKPIRARVKGLNAPNSESTFKPPSRH